MYKLGCTSNTAYSSSVKSLFLFGNYCQTFVFAKQATGRLVDNLEPTFEDDWSNPQDSALQVMQVTFKVSAFLQCKRAITASSRAVKTEWALWTRQCQNYAVFETKNFEPI